MGYMEKIAFGLMNMKQHAGNHNHTNNAPNKTYE
jgi:hypothetical protein